MLHNSLHDLQLLPYIMINYQFLLYTTLHSICIIQPRIFCLPCYTLVYFVFIVVEDR